MVAKIALVSLALILAGSGAPSPAFTKTPMSISASAWDVEAVEPYAGARAKGRVTQCPQASGVPDRGAIVAVGGIASLANPGTDAALTCRFSADSWKAYAISRGFSVYILTWYAPTDYISEMRLS